jgi:hypothetical protein
VQGVAASGWGVQGEGEGKLVWARRGSGGLEREGRRSCGWVLAAAPVGLLGWLARAEAGRKYHTPRQPADPMGRADGRACERAAAPGVGGRAGICPAGTSADESASLSASSRFSTGIIRHTTSNTYVFANLSALHLELPP